jgi:oxygen-independent coproporphyrinogen-3 oxidase
MNTTRPPLSLYVHWPWCQQKCPYCDFNAHAAESWPEKSYFSFLIRDLYEQSSRVSNRLLTEIYIGGGTPSLISPEQIGYFLEEVNRLFPFASDIEISMEANPSSRPEFMAYREAGVNRFSIGLQALDNALLQRLGRTHSVADSLTTLEDAQKAAHNINLDLIYGIPGQSLSQWERQLVELLERFNPPHISAYQLTIEPNSMFYSQVRRQHWHLADDDTLADFFDLTRSTLQEYGFANYEISNFAQPGFACKHNLHVWRGGDYLGIGAGAHGRVTINGTLYARQAKRQPANYMAVGQKTSLYTETPLDPETSVQELFLCSLRLKEGVCKGSLEKRLKNAPYEEAVDLKTYQRLLDDNLLEETSSHIRLTEKGWPLLDQILSHLLLNDRTPPAVQPATLPKNKLKILPPPAV